MIKIQDTLVIRKYTIDILLIAVFTIFALVFVDKPKVNYEINKGEGTVRNDMHMRNTTETVRETEPANKTLSYKNIEERNIFTADGNYASGKGLMPMPENPYNLIAILQGKEKMAVFRDYTGSVVALKIKEKLIDGAVITHIDGLYVITKKGRETREYRIFDVKPMNK